MATAEEALAVTDIDRLGKCLDIIREEIHLMRVKLRAALACCELNTQESDTQGARGLSQSKEAMRTAAR